MVVNRRHSVPIRVNRAPRRPVRAPSQAATTPLVEESAPLVEEVECNSAPQPAPSEGASPVGQEELEEWRDRALRLQAEMDNFRKRQRRLADDRVAADRERLLQAFLTVSDDLGRALNVDDTDVETLVSGVTITHNSLMHILDREGVQLIQAKGESFDPNLHEAVATVSSQEVDVEPETIVEIVQQGYTLGDRLLRPARVVVAT
jgi:molecular chaperone GrpE